MNIINHVNNVESLICEITSRMVRGELSYFDGARKMLDLKPLAKMQGIDERLFDIFLVICSETDHIPNQALRKYLKNQDLLNLQMELDKTEEWAKLFAEDACRKIISKLNNC